MTTLSQSPRDRILWILANNGGKIERSRLKRCTGMRYALLNPILEELVRNVDRVFYFDEGSNHAEGFLVIHWP